MNILLTGGAGYIGSHICNSLIDLGFNVSTIDNLSTGSVDLIPKKVEHINCDISDIKTVTALIKKNNFDVVMHLAAFTRVGESVKYPEKYYENNDVLPRMGCGTHPHQYYFELFSSYFPWRVNNTKILKLSFYHQKQYI